MRYKIIIIMLFASLGAMAQLGNTSVSTVFPSITINGTATVNGDLVVTGESTLHGGMFLNENTTAQTPVAGDVIGMTEFSAGPLNGFTFEAGESGTIASTADNGAFVTVTCGGAHTVDVGDWVVISQASTNGSYDITGVYEVTADGGTTFDITFADWDASETGVWQSPSQLTLTTVGVSADTYSIIWNLSVSCAGTPAGDVVDWGVYVNATPYVQTYARRSLSTGSVWGAMGGGGLVDLTTGDVIYLFFNSDDVNALTHRVGSLRITQL